MKKKVYEFKKVCGQFVADCQRPTKSRHEDKVRLCAGAFRKKIEMPVDEFTMVVSERPINNHSMKVEFVVKPTEFYMFLDGKKWRGAFLYEALEELRWLRRKELRGKNKKFYVTCFYREDK
jgi:hypothetical protein